MRLVHILILGILAALLLLPGAGSAETNAECTTRCTAEKAARDASCSPNDNPDQAQLQCLQESQDTFNKCAVDCPQPDPNEAPEERHGAE